MSNKIYQLKYINLLHYPILLFFLDPYHTRHSSFQLFTEENGALFRQNYSGFSSFAPFLCSLSYLRATFSSLHQIFSNHLTNLLNFYLCLSFPLTHFTLSKLTG